MAYHVKGFEFSLRELAGSLGDFGTLFPLAIGYIVVCGLNPSGFLVMMGIANIILGLIYRLPMPLQPKKVVAVVAISQRWTPQMIYSCGLGLGIFWLLFSFTGLIEKIVKSIPKCVVRGIQVALGFMLGLLGLSMVKEAGWIDGWLLGLISIFIILIFKENKRTPAAIILVLLGIILIGAQGKLKGVFELGINLPPLILPRMDMVLKTFLLAGIAQVPLTITNAVIACAALIRDYFPDKAVSEKKLLINQAIMNLVGPFFGGMPMCHGAGGLAGQYYFGARTGGANIMEGLIEIALGLFLASSIVGIFSVFPKAIIGAMLIMVGIALLKFAKDVKGTKEIISMAFTIFISIFTKNMAIGFVSGILVYYLLNQLPKMGIGC
jgi:MFS superfamily sulfate permease-like transporter